MSDRLLLYFDGRCAGLGTPGALATYGWVFLHGEEIMSSGKGVAAQGEDATANIGEYVALISGLRALLDRNPGGIAAVEIRGDSQLVIRQMTGVYGCWAPHLQPLYETAVDLARRLQKGGCQVLFRWIPREENTQADALSREAFDEARAQDGAGMDGYDGRGDPVAASIGSL